MNDELKNLIIASLKSGEIDKKKLNVLRKKANSLGISNEELDIYIESLENEHYKNSSTEDDLNLSKALSKSVKYTAYNLIAFIPYAVLGLIIVGVIYWLSSNWTYALWALVGLAIISFAIFIFTSIFGD
jgi:hypothetical protein